MKNKHYLDPVNVPKNINKNRFLNFKQIAEEFQLSELAARQFVDQCKFHKRAEIITPKYTDHHYLTTVNINDVTINNVPTNSPRDYYFKTMFDNIYFELTRFLSDLGISNLMSQLSENYTSVSGWGTYFSDYQIIMNERSLEFIKYGKLILCTEAIYKNYKPKWELDQC